MQGRVLEPCRLTAELKQAGGTTDVEVGVSALRLNVAVDVVELATSLQASVLEPLAQPDPTKCACSRLHIVQGPPPSTGFGYAACKDRVLGVASSNKTLSPSEQA